MESVKILQNAWNFFVPNKANHYKPAFLYTNVMIYIVVGILAVKIVSLVFYLPLSQNIFFADITKIDLLTLLNENRKSEGLNPLSENSTLDQVAYLKAKDMISNGYFAHQSPTGISPWFWFNKVGYNYKYAGENLAVGFVDSKTVYDAWVNSPSHKQNLLNKNYTDVGTAIVSGFEGNSILVVQEFGSPMTKSTPKTTPTPAVTIKPQFTPITPEPVKETPTPAPSTNNSNTLTTKVLGQSTQYIQKPYSNTTDSWYLKVLNFLVYDTDTIFLFFCYSMITLLITYLVFNEILIIQMQNRVMVLQLVLAIAILGFSIWLNKENLSYILPYHVTI